MVEQRWSNTRRGRAGGRRHGGEDGGGGGGEGGGQDGGGEADDCGPAQPDGERADAVGPVAVHLRPDRPAVKSCAGQIMRWSKRCRTLPGEERERTERERMPWARPLFTRGRIGRR